MTKTSKENTANKLIPATENYFNEREKLLVSELNRVAQLRDQADTTFKHLEGAIGELRKARDAVLGEAGK